VYATVIYAYVLFEYGPHQLDVGMWNTTQEAGDRGYATGDRAVSDPI
jgi:hypothetical protein